MATSGSTAAAPSVRAGGELLAALLLQGGAPATDAADHSALQATLRAAALEESSHEIIALEGDRLVLQEANWTRFRESVDCEGPMLVASFLGDTSAGKSHTIRQLMGDDETRPFVQPSRTQSLATTFNVNLYPSTTLVPGVTVNFVDFEGENGTSAPVMAAARAVADAAAAAVATATTARHKAVTEFFPKLAYTTSDVVVVISREPFFNRRYLERCIEFSKRANAGVTNVERPALVLVGNKLPGEECETDIHKSTSQFFDAWGEDARVLDQYFSAVVCLYIPHKRGLWRADHSPDAPMVDGKVVFEQQIEQLRRILRVLALRKAASQTEAASGASGASGGAGGGGGAGAGTGTAAGMRQITRQSGLWFQLLPRVIQELNAGRGVDVSSLIDELWADALAKMNEDEEAELDQFRSFLTFLRPPRTLSASARPGELNEDIVDRIRRFLRLALDASARLVACRVRRLDRAVRVEAKIRRYAARLLSAIRRALDDQTPCIAVYDVYRERGTEPTERPEDPILCLEERRHHACHRTSRRVTGGRGVWNRLLGLFPYNEVWDGVFEAPVSASELDRLQARAIDEVVRLDALSEPDFLADLVDFQTRHSELLSGGGRGPASSSGAKRVSVGFVQLTMPRDPATGDRLKRADLTNLLPPSDPIPETVAAALRTLPVLTCKPTMPYCLGCGVKVSAGLKSKRDRTRDGTETEKENGREEAAGGKSASGGGARGGGGWLGARMWSAVFGGTDDAEEPTARASGGSEPGKEEAEVVPYADEFTDDATVSLSTLLGARSARRGEVGSREREGAGVTTLLAEAERASILAAVEERLGDPTTPASPLHSAGSTFLGGLPSPSEPSTPTTAVQNLWCGLCPRCWDAAVIEPARRRVVDASDGARRGPVKTALAFD